MKTSLIAWIFALILGAGIAPLARADVGSIIEQEQALRVNATESEILTRVVDLEALYAEEPKRPLSGLADTYRFLTEKSKFKGKPATLFVRGRLAALKTVGDESRLGAKAAFALVVKDQLEPGAEAKDELAREGRLVVLRLVAKRKLVAGAADPLWNLVAGEVSYQATRSGHGDFEAFLRAVKGLEAKTDPAHLKLARTREALLRGSEFPVR